MQHPICQYQAGEEAALEVGSCHAISGLPDAARTLWFRSAYWGGFRDYIYPQRSRNSVMTSWGIGFILVSASRFNHDSSALRQDHLMEPVLPKSGSPEAEDANCS